MARLLPHNSASYCTSKALISVNTTALEIFAICVLGIAIALRLFSRRKNLWSLYACTFTCISAKAIDLSIDRRMRTAGISSIRAIDVALSLYVLATLSLTLFYPRHVFPFRSRPLPFVCLAMRNINARGNHAMRCDAAPQNPYSSVIITQCKD